MLIPVQALASSTCRQASHTKKAGWRCQNFVEQLRNCVAPRGFWVLELRHGLDAIHSLWVALDFLLQAPGPGLWAAYVRPTEMAKLGGLGWVVLHGFAHVLIHSDTMRETA